MKKIMFSLANYHDDRQMKFVKYFSPRNKEYAERHGFVYDDWGQGCKLEYPPFLAIHRNHPSWMKMFVVKNLIEFNHVTDGDIVTSLDADMCIVKGNLPYQPDEGKSFCYAIDNGNTHCMGSFSMRINEWTRKLVDMFTSDEYYNANKDREHWVNAWEQACWYTMCGIPVHSWVSFFDKEKYANYGFHADTEVNTNPIFTLDELDQHVQILSPDWNGTLFDDECGDSVSQSLMKYNINKSDKKNLRIRHFAGGQPWALAYAFRPINWNE